jgi:hypothetical protein
MEMDDDQRQENTINIPTHDLIITKINDRDKLWDVRHKALLDAIAAQDKANGLRFDALNKVKELQTDLLNRCSTKDEVKLAITEKSNELELKLKDKENALREALANEANLLKGNINDNKNQLDTAMLLIKIIIGFLFTLFITLIFEYTRHIGG